MKKISLLFLFFASTFTNCSIKEYVYCSTYVYHNASSKDITVESHSLPPRLDRDSIFVISQGGSYTLKFHCEGGFPEPFMWGESGPSPGSADYTVFSSQDKQFTHTPMDPSLRNLYKEHTYQLVHSEKLERTSQYTFTDADFADAASIISITKLDIPPFWNAMEINTDVLYVIRSADELRKLIAEPIELPQIDFTKNSVIIIIIRDARGENTQVDVDLWRTNAGNFKCEVILKGIHDWEKWGKAFTTPVISSTATVDLNTHYIL